MSTRTLEGFTKYVIERAHSEPNPDAREAYRDILRRLCALDKGDAADVIAATEPLVTGLGELPRDWTVGPATCPNGHEIPPFDTACGLCPEVA